MAWIGWQEGMDGAIVLAAIGELRALFSYGKNLTLTTKFTPELTAALSTYQQKKGGLPRTDGVLDYATQSALKLSEAMKPVIFTAQGTGADMWTGYPADLARSVLDRYRWQPTGNYPASVFPMNKSVDKGIAEMVLQIRRLMDRYPAAQIVLAGYSQGAVVTSMVYKHYLADPNGSLNDLLPRFKAGITYGNPNRQEGKANGNRRVGQPVPEGRGLAPDRLENTPANWLDYAHGANGPFGRDLYTDCPNDKTGEFETAIFNIIFSKFIGVDSIIEQLGEVVANPITAIWAIKAVFNGIGFVATQPFPTAPHCDYDPWDASLYLRSIA